MSSARWPSNPVRGLVLLLLLFSYLYRVGGSNPPSRLMALCAMSEYHTFRVDAYVGAERSTPAWTDDWARTPDGHYYSNKAPGPMLVAFPAFWAFDRAMTRGLATPAERDRFRHGNQREYLYFLSVLLQVVPTALLVGFLARFLQRHLGASRGAVLAFATTTLFGSPASFFFSSYFGHGLAAWLTLGFGVSLWLRKPLLGGLLFGLALLSDYGSMFLLPAFLIAVGVFLPQPSSFLMRFAVGASAPAALWAFYHTACFGSPLTLPNAFQNPVFRDMADRKYNLWGVFVPVPDLGVTLRLLVGPNRGLLVKSTWVAVVLAWLLLHRADVRRAPAGLKALLTLGLGGLLGLLYMNSCFGGWHGGAVPVARYLSASVPLLALATALFYDAWAPRWRRALHVAIAASCAYFLYYNVFRLPYMFRHVEVPPLASPERLWQAAEWVVVAALLALGAFVDPIRDHLKGRVTPA